MEKRWTQVVTELSRAFAFCAVSDKAAAIRDDVGLAVIAFLWNRRR